MELLRISCIQLKQKHLKNWYIIEHIRVKLRSIFAEDGFDVLKIRYFFSTCPELPEIIVIVMFSITVRVEYFLTESLFSFLFPSHPRVSEM